MASYDDRSADVEPTGVAAFLESWSAWTLSHRGIVLGVIALVTALAVWPAATVPYQGTIIEAFVDDPVEYDEYLQRCAEFGGNPDELVFAATDEGDELFMPQTLDAIRAAAAELALFPEVAAVACLSDAPRTAPSRLTTRQTAQRAAARRKLRDGTLDLAADEIEVEPYWPVSASRRAQVDPSALRREAIDDRLLRGTLLSADGRAQGMVLQLRGATTIPLPSQIDLERRIGAVLQKHGLGKNGIHTAGTVPLQGWIFGEMDRTVRRLMPIGGLLLAGILWILFRRAAVVIVTALSAATAVAWAIGFAAVVFGNLSILVAAAPLLIMVIVTAETVYLTAAYNNETRAGLPREVALRKVVSEVGGACVLTSLTTFIGFASLITVGAPTMQHLALTVAVGVAVGLLLTLTLVPVAYSFLPPFENSNDAPRRRDAQRFVRRLIEPCRRLAVTHPYVIIAVFSAIAAAAVVVCLPMKIDPNVPARFPADHPLPRAVAFFNQRMSGTTYVELFLDAEPRHWTGPDAIRRLVRLEQAIDNLPEVRAVRSVVDVYRTVDRSLGFGTPDGLPPTQEVAAAALRAAAALGGDAVRGMINDGRDRLRIVIQLTPSGYIEVMTVGERIEALAAAAFPEARARVIGSYPIVGAVVVRIIRGYFSGNIVSTIAIWLTMAWGLRSFGVAAWAMVPNLIPMTLLGALLVLTLGTIDSDLLMVPMTALGIAVDDTIHFLHRYHLELTRSGNRDTALSRTYDYTGSAILQTTLLLSAGFSPYALSPFLSVWMLGTYMVFTLLVAVLADLLLTPAMARIGLFRWRT